TRLLLIDTVLSQRHDSHVKKSIVSHKMFAPALGAAIAVAIGLGLRFLPAGASWAKWSYDQTLRYGTRAVTNQVALILMDNDAYHDLHQTRGQWSRKLHADLWNKP